MLPNSITLAVDTANNGTTANETWSRTSYGTNDSLYVGPLNNTGIIRDQLRFTRSYPQKSGNFAGYLVSTVKFVREIEVEGVNITTLEKRPITVELRVVVPAGATTAEVVEARQRMLALMDNDTIMTAANSQLDV